MPVSKSETVELRIEQDIVRARQVVRKLAQDCAFSLVDQTKMVTAASELARNTVTYGQGGTVLCEQILDGLIVAAEMNRGPQLQAHHPVALQQAEVDMDGVLQMGQQDTLFQDEAIHFVAPDRQSLLQAKLLQVIGAVQLQGVGAFLAPEEEGLAVG